MSRSPPTFDLVNFWTRVVFRVATGDTLVSLLTLFFKWHFLGHLTLLGHFLAKVALFLLSSTILQKKNFFRQKTGRKTVNVDMHRYPFSVS